MIDKSTKKTEPDPRLTSEGAVLFWLHQADRAVRGEVLRQFRSMGRDLGTAQWEVLTHLWQRDGASQTALARGAGRDKAGMTRLLDRMEREALVERRPDPADRRVSRVFLTPAGRALHGDLLPIVNAVIEQALQEVDEATLGALRQGLKHIHQNLAGAPVGSGL